MYGGQVDLGLLIQCNTGKLRQQGEKSLWNSLIASLLGRDCPLLPIVLEEVYCPKYQFTI